MEAGLEPAGEVRVRSDGADVVGAEGDDDGRDLQPLDQIVEELMRRARRDVRREELFELIDDHHGRRARRLECGDQGGVRIPAGSEHGDRPARSAQPAGHPGSDQGGLATAGRTHNRQKW